MDTKYDKKLTLLFFIMLTPTLSYSYQCIMLISNVDSAIMKIDENKYSNLIEAAKMLKKKVKKLMIMVITYYLKRF